MPADCVKLLVFQIGGECCALRVGAVREIVPMAALAKPPGRPSVLEGFLNLRGVATAVVRLDRLFDLPPAEAGLGARLIVLRDCTNASPAALLAESVDEIVDVPAGALLPVPENNCFHDAGEAMVVLGDRTAHLLRPERVLIESERRSIAEFQARAQQLVDELEGRPA
jgi:purine-binding chemotaxis protein CheW